ncbi:TetR/AcrR family transcriptional regulator [Allokutzneria sp. A3M-2-11 16]|uniref:TetR/AcrR family transcriptional regulator n=1 Tax=Allokutzneria sp. A3M-2-11 16 TaxID=2962043 RepID=UPI0020B8CFF1|nr:TetR/AcrR family transcriptional regulator [Allokutzneria sp. A3M-2-11 16]MCP3802961.1 TetR/AcrR family transcriptional regulator [Allokutzneria sp. A3M-2-11 16]
MATKQQQREQTTAALHTTARRLFAEHGYPNVGLETIAQAAGVTKGALYHHFSSKAALFRHVLARIQDEVGERVHQAADAHPDPWTQLVEGCRAFLDAGTDPEVQQIMLIDGPAVLGWNEWRTLDDQSSARHLADALHTLVDTGTIPRQPVEPLARLLSGAMNEAALWLAQSDDTEADRDATMAALTRMLTALRAP